MKIARRFWAVPVLAILSTSAAMLTGLLADDEPAVAQASVFVASAPAISVYISRPGVEGPPALAGLAMETFDSRLTCPSGASPSVTTGTALAVGTLSGQTLVLGCVGAATTSAEVMPHTDPSGSDYPTASRSAHASPPSSGAPAIITLNQPSDYLGVYWIWGNSGDQFVLRSQGADVLNFSTADLMKLLPTGGQVSAIGGGTYQQNHYLGGRKAFGSGSNTEPMVYLHFVAPPGVSFDEVRLSPGTLEFDNLATASLSATFDPTGLVGVPLNSSSITYDTQGGSSVSPGLYSAGSTATLAAAPTRAGYEFLGWATTSAGTPLGTNYTPPVGAGDITLYAQWAPIVTFDVNGATGTDATQSATGNTALRSNTYTRSGYTFAGWNTAADGSGNSYANGAMFNFTTPTTLYAQWTLTPPPPPVQTTTPTTTIPAATIAPVLDSAGELPTLQPGDSMVTDNGNPVPVEVFFDGTDTLVMRGQDFELNLAGQCDGGCDLITDSTGRQILQLQQDGNALVGGFGFMPGTLVHVWVFSEPTYLGALTVADDGTFAGSMYLEGIAPGTHTLQVNGTSFDGNDRSANLGVIVLANSDPSPPLPATGGGNTAPQLVVAALAMVMLGALARRRAAAR